MDYFLNKKIILIFVAVLAIMSCGGQKEPKPEFVSPIKQVGWMGVRASDLSKAKEFFKQTLELDIHTSAEGVEIFQLPNGQFFELLSDSVPDSELFKEPLLGFEVENVKNARRSLEANGLKFEGDTQNLLDFSWSFFKDHEQNLLVIVSTPPPKLFPQTDKKLKILSMGWIGYNVDDHKAAYQFYNKKLGLQAAALDTEHFTAIPFSNQTIFEVLNRSTVMELPVNYPVIGFQVDNLKESVEILKERKVKLIGTLQSESPELAWQYFEGPDGIVYELIELK